MDQLRRRNGQYDRYNPCELCGASAGKNYYSDERCNYEWHGHGLILCQECAVRLGGMDDAAGLAALEKKSP